MTYLPDIDADFSESKPDEHLERIRQEHEPFLTRLEALAVCAIASGDWDDLYDFLNEARGVTNPPRLHRVSLQEFLTRHPCTSIQTTITEGQGADELHSPSAPTCPTTENNR